MNKPRIPAFGSEAEEARWWYANRDKLDPGLEDAAGGGTLKKLSRGDLLKRVATSRVVSLRIPETDLAMARRLAAEKGLPYQTYMKSLLHEALKKEEKRRAG